MADRPGFGDDIEQALAQLSALDFEMENVLPEVAALGADIVAAEARLRAPVRTGELKRSIVARAEGEGPDSAEAVVAVDAFYGYWIEYGRKSAAAQPFLRPAVDVSRQRIRQAIGKRLQVVTRMVGRR